MSETFRLEITRISDRGHTTDVVAVDSAQQLDDLSASVSEAVRRWQSASPTAASFDDFLASLDGTPTPRMLGYLTAAYEAGMRASARKVASRVRDAALSAASQVQSLRSLNGMIDDGPTLAMLGLVITSTERLAVSISRITDAVGGMSAPKPMEPARLGLARKRVAAFLDMPPAMLAELRTPQLLIEVLGDRDYHAMVLEDLIEHLVARAPDEVEWLRDRYPGLLPERAANDGGES